MEALLWGPLEVRGCISMNEMHDMNDVHPLLPEVPDEKVSLLF